MQAKMGRSPPLSDESDHAEGDRETLNKSADDASAGGMRSPQKGKGNRPKPVKAKATAAKNAKKLAPLPPRALNAYNIFFRDERKRWIDQRDKPKEDDATESSMASTFPPFAQMGKIIGQKWKELPAKEKLIFENLAKEDMRRYRKEVDDYKSKLIQETEKSAETLGSDTVSSAWNYGSSFTEDETEGDSKPEASNLPQRVLPSTHGPVDALTHNSNVAGFALPHAAHPFGAAMSGVSQFNSQTQVHSLLHQVIHDSQYANTLGYSQQQQQQLLSVLLPRMNLRQSQEQQQLLQRLQQLERNQQDISLLQLVNSYLPYDATVASMFGSSYSPPSLIGRTHTNLPVPVTSILQSNPWQSALQLSSNFSPGLDSQLRLSALLRQQHLMQQLAEQSNEGVGTKPPPHPPS